MEGVPLGNQDTRSKEQTDGSEDALPQRPELALRDFKPPYASNETLIKYGFPPRPSRSTHPRQRALWDRTIGLPMQMSSSLEAPVKLGSPVSALIIPIPLGPSPELSGVAGVVQTFPGCNNVTGSWVILNPIPPAYARNQDGTYQDGTWAVTWLHPA
jgi:hypothetical protein